MKKMGMRERLYGWLSYKLVLACGNMALARGDIHEARHCILALKLGNSTHSAQSPCPIVEVDRHAN